MMVKLTVLLNPQITREANKYPGGVRISAKRSSVDEAKEAIYDFFEHGGWIREKTDVLIENIVVEENE